jgi:hypothetical protein
MPAKSLRDFAFKMQEHRVAQLQKFDVSENKEVGGTYLTTKLPQNDRCIFFHSHSRQCGTRCRV